MKKKSKLLISSIILAAAFLFIILQIGSTADSYNVSFEGQELKLTQPIININGRLMYPFRECLEALGATATWDEPGKSVKGTLNDKTVEFLIDALGYYDNGEVKLMDKGVTAFIRENRTYIPIRYAAESLGYEVAWDAVTRTVSIISPAIINKPKIDVQPYRVLMVFASEVRAQLPLKADPREKIDIHIKMSDLEKGICLKFYDEVSKWLKDALDGITEIEVDCYFTSKPLLTEDFNIQPWQTLSVDATIIPEIKNIINNYQSTILTVNMGYQRDLIDMNSHAGNETGNHCVYFWDIIVNSLTSSYSSESKEQYAYFLENGSLNEDGYNKMMHEFSLGYKLEWDSPGSEWLTFNLGYYISEFIHACSAQLANSYGMHPYYFSSARNAYYRLGPNLYELAISRLYLRNEAHMYELGLESPKVGIPKSFWTGNPDLRYTVIFDSNGGSPENTMTDVLPNSKVTKPADPVREGYVFDGWHIANFDVEWDWDNVYVNTNTVFYAKWNPVGSPNPALFEILFILNGGALESGTKTQIITPETANISKPFLPGWNYALYFGKDSNTAIPVSTLTDIKELWQAAGEPYFMVLHTSWY